MRVAIVHPWFFDSDGANQVIDALAEIYPEADIFTLFEDRDCMPPNVKGKKVHSSALQRIIGNAFRTKRTYFMSLFPLLVESMNVNGYDLVFTSCGIAVMGVNVRQDAVHICYVHTPQRDCWDLYSKRQANRGWLKRKLFAVSASYLKLWEFNAIQRVDYVVSNSHYIQNRVKKYFRRGSTVIYPPVNTSMGYLAREHKGYYLSLSRLDREKRIDLLIGACNALKRPLLIGGRGPEEAKLRALSGPTVRFLGRVPQDELPKLYAECRAMLFAADEDFGIAPVEAQAFGRPVIAYGHGGCLETVLTGQMAGGSDSGVLFPEQTVESVIEAIKQFEAREDEFCPIKIQKHAFHFDKAVFSAKIRKLADSAMGREGSEGEREIGSDEGYSGRYSDGSGGRPESRISSERRTLNSGLQF